jgi:hypothetical protein
MIPMERQHMVQALMELVKGVNMLTLAHMHMELANQKKMDTLALIMLLISMMNILQKRNRSLRKCNQ